MSKFKKIDKEYALSDSTVNTYGFRLLTSGYQADEFKRNPIGYYMHLRDSGVLLRWEDIRIDGDVVYGKPVVNLSHPRGQQTVDEIENGFLNAASFGHFVVLESSDDPALKLEGQTGPTITKWYNRECSLVDVPGNVNSLAPVLFDANGETINLADFSIKNSQMKQIFLSADQLAKLNLKADSDQAAQTLAIDNLIATAAKVPGLEQQLSAANTAKADAEKKMQDLQAESVKKEVEAIIKDGLDSKKLTADLAKNLKADYATNPTGLKALVDSMPGFQSITGGIDANKKQFADLASKTYEELDREGKLEDLKASNPELFKEKFKAQFGTDYQGS